MALLAAAPVFTAPAYAAPPPGVAAAQAAAGPSPLGTDAIRFTAIQPYGRGATIYQAERGSGGTTRTIIDLGATPGGGWTVDGRETRPLAGETLDYLRGRIDAALPGPAVEACGDAPQYYAEHGDRAIAGCGPDGATGAIARALGLADAIQP